MNKKRNRPRHQILLVVSLALLPALSCGARRSPSSADPSSQAPSADHALPDIRIREIMGRLALPLDRMPQEVDPVSHRQLLLEEMAAAAQELEENAGRIPEVLEKVQMSEPHRREFLEYAHQLARQAAELGDRAKRGDLAAAEQTLESIDATCKSCHERFRVLPLRGRDEG